MAAESKNDITNAEYSLAPWDLRKVLLTECKVLNGHFYYAEGTAFSLLEAEREKTKATMTFCV